MNPFILSLINTLEALGVMLRASQAHIEWEAPPGVITSKHTAFLKKFKFQVIRLLQLREQEQYLQSVQNTIVLSDCMKVLQKMPDNSIDAMICDGPFGWEFMGKDWDKAVPGVEIWKECLRVLKPGGFAFVMSGPRQDGLERMINNLRQAGFQISFSPIYHTYASGFPKIHNIAKAVDKKNGKKGKVIGIKKNKINFSNSRKGDTSFYDAAWQDGNYTDLQVTEPETKQAKALEGAYAGFQPKPAVEVILVVMKPLAEKSYTEQALANGKGCTWMDDCRIPYATEKVPSRDLVRQKSSAGGQVPASEGESWGGHSEGRFPANLLISDDVLDDGESHSESKGTQYSYPDRHYDCDGFISKIKPQAPSNYNDSGSFSRFFSLDAWAERNLPYLIVPKANKAEKNAGLDGLEARSFNDGKTKITGHLKQWGDSQRKNIHPTVKPIKLMAYLISMASRPGDLILDPFCGSGTTCIAAKLLDRKFIGIEKDPEYHKIAAARVENASLDVPVLKRAVTDIRKHEESREKEKDTETPRAPEPCFFSNMTEKQLKGLDKELDKED